MINWTNMPSVPIDLDNPNLTRISLRTLVNALFRLHRYAGHGDNVALHSWRVYLLANAHDPLDQSLHRAALLHDLHEAIIGEIPTPTKRYCGYAFLALDARIDKACQERFSYRSAQHRETIKRLDYIDHVAERSLFCDDLPWQDGPAIEPSLLAKARKNLKYGILPSEFYEIAISLGAEK